jgi:LysM repeat protein
MKKATFLVFSLIFALSLTARDAGRISRDEYIRMHAADAVSDMQKTGVPASITLAQALLESDDGNSSLAKEANNHFGIKCANWSGKAVYQDDDKRNECFRKYNSVLESYDDHSDFLRTRDRYAFLFELDRTDYKGWARGLKKAGYATNPQYANLLIKIIEDNNLQAFDVITGMPPVASRRKSDGWADRPQPVRRESEAVTIAAIAERPVLTNNNVRYVIARKGDSYKKISDELGMAPWEIYKYNDASRNDVLSEGQMVYIKPKRRKGEEKFYTVKPGDTVLSISAQLGVKSKSICKFNGLTVDSSVQPGDVLWLQSKKPAVKS